VAHREAKLLVQELREVVRPLLKSRRPSCRPTWKLLRRQMAKMVVWS